MKRYRYSRQDFKSLPVKLEHMDIHLNFLDGRVRGANTLRITAREPLEVVRLDARDLEIHAVEWPETKPLDYEYRRGENALIVKLPRPVPAGETFSLRTVTTCVPADNVLEGIYKDTTPPGCPQQYMSQCQQWGFQRILPVVDDCTAKCTYVTTLEADARYTHLISNGNVRRATNPDGKPVRKPGDPTRQVITYENLIPMAPYLFLACVGTWDVLEEEVVYPSGRRVKLEYLVPPGRVAGAAVPMKILKESVLWLARTQEYEYPREVYRTICMEKSNFGGMENVGNTTIVTDAALVDEFTGDGRLVYAYRVIPHEFEHNQCGSDVTMETPFDMWLNEAFTVDVERQFMGSQFDPDWVRLEEVDSMRAPVSGPLAVEEAGHMGNIVREGFNDPDELVDGLTYVKAAEAIRMLRLVLGEDAFRRGKNLYFSRHSGGNANTDQFFACFQEVSGRDLAAFKREWLFRIGFPKVRASWRYDGKTKTLRVRFRQARTKSRRKPWPGVGGAFHVPVEMAAVDRNGKDIPETARTIELTGALTETTFENVPRPAFVSLNRNLSFYGTFTDASATPARLRRQIRRDPNGFNRVEAMRRLTERERVRLIGNPGAEVGEDWLDVYAECLRDTHVSSGLKAHLLRVDEASLDPRWLPFPRERYRARIALLRAVATRRGEDLLRAYRSVDTYRAAIEPRDGIEERGLKAVLLRTLIEARTPETDELAVEHFRKAWNITDQVSALHAVNLSDHPSRLELLEEAYGRWKDRLSAYSAYLAVVPGGTHEDVFDRIAAEERRPTFRIEHPTHNRALYAVFAGNNKMLWTDRGIQWVAETVIRLARVNENTANRLLAAFQLVRRLADDLRPKVVAALEAMRDGVDAATCPSTAGRIRMYLENVGKAAARGGSRG